MSKLICKHTVHRERLSDWCKHSSDTHVHLCVSMPGEQSAVIGLKVLNLNRPISSSLCVWSGNPCWDTNTVWVPLRNLWQCEHDHTCLQHWNCPRAESSWRCVDADGVLVYIVCFTVCIKLIFLLSAATAAYMFTCMFGCERERVFVSDYRPPSKFFIELKLSLFENIKDII